MNTGDTIQLIVTRRYENQLQTTIEWEGVVPHDSDYPTLNELGAELGYEILEAIARQKPWPVVSITVVKW